MNITRNNYEAFFLDFLEGNLEEDKVDLFLDFLEQNLDLKTELQQYENVVLPEKQVVFWGKQQLYKGVADRVHILDNKAIAYLEGDLDGEEKKLFELYISNNPELEAEYRLFARTKLTPDTRIKYPNRKKLYIKSGSSIVLNWVVRAAAVVVLFWGIYSWLNSGIPLQQQTNIQLAGTSPRSNLKVQEKVEAVKQFEPKRSEVRERKSKHIVPDSKQQIITQTPIIQSTEIVSEKELTSMSEISPIQAQLNTDAVKPGLAVHQLNNEQQNQSITEAVKLEEFLATKAKKAGNTGLLSAKRIALLGLNLASEISGDRIGYAEKDGKIVSVEFESKLLAFSIPLEKTK